MLRRHAFRVIPLSLVLSFGAAALPPEGEIWTAVETPRLLVATNGSVETAKAVAEAFETLYETLTQVGGAESLSRLGRGTVLVFRDRASLAPYWQPSVPAHQPGFVTVGEEAGIAVLDGSVESGLLRSLYKQFVLQLLDRDYPAAPLWVRYGLAEYLSTLERTGSTVTVGNMTFGKLAQVAVIGRIERDLDWPEVFSATALPSDPEASRTFIEKSTLLIHFALSRPVEERRTFAEFLRRAGAGEAQEEAWQAVFGHELATLGPAADAYGTSRERKMLRFEVQPSAQRQLGVRALPRAESLALLGELLVRFGPRHRAAALEHFAGSTELEPGNGVAWQRRAMLYRLAGQKSEAWAAIDRAAALLPDDLAVQLDAAAAVLERLPRDRALDGVEKARLATVRATLARMAAAEPESARVWTALAAVWSHEPLPPPEGLAAFERAFALAPDRADFGYNALLGRIRQGDAAGAEKLLAALEARPGDGRILERARNAVAGLDLKEAARLARAGKTTEAALQYARVLARATDPALVEPAVGALAQAAKAGRDRVFVEAYLNVIRLFEAGDAEAGRKALDELAAAAQPGAQAKAVTALRERFLR